MQKLVKITETLFIPFKTLFLLIFFKLAEKKSLKVFSLGSLNMFSNKYIGYFLQNVPIGKELFAGLQL